MTHVESGLFFLQFFCKYVIIFIPLRGSWMKIVTVHLISVSYSLHTAPAAHAEQANNMIITQATWFIHSTQPFYSSCSLLFNKMLWGSLKYFSVQGQTPQVVFQDASRINSLKAFHRSAQRLSENNTAGSSVCWRRLRRFYHLLFALIGFEEIKLACFIFKWSECSPTEVR